MAGPKYILHAKTDRGRRKNNEDSFLARKIGEDAYLLAVADGMGGGVAGELASSTVIEVLEQSVLTSLTHNTAATDLKSILIEAYHMLQVRLHEKIERDPDLAGMGTTLTVLLVHQQNYVWANIGDSRLYKFHNGEVTQLTKDHSHIQELIDSGKNPDAAYIAAHSNLITKVIGNTTEEPDIYPMDSSYDTLFPETTLLLCSDGLITNHPEDEIRKSIEQIYFSGTNLDSTFDLLIQDAKEKGSRDNITVASIEFGSFARKKNRLKINLVKSLSQLPHQKLALWISATVLSIVTIGILFALFNRGYFDFINSKSKLLSKQEIWELKIENHFEVSRSNSLVPISNSYPEGSLLKAIRYIWYDEYSEAQDTLIESRDLKRLDVNKFNPDPFDPVFQMFEIRVRADGLYGTDSIIPAGTATISIIRE